MPRTRMTTQARNRRRREREMAALDHKLRVADLKLRMKMTRMHAEHLKRTLSAKAKP